MLQFMETVGLWVQGMQQSTSGDLQKGSLWHMDFSSFDDVFFTLLLLSPPEPLALALPSSLTLILAAAMPATTGGFLRLRLRL